jgi:hypothetical protein
VGKVYPSAQSLKPIRIVRVHWYGQVWCGMTISVYDLRKQGSAMGAGSSVVVECENVLLLSLGVNHQSIVFL